MEDSFQPDSSDSFTADTAKHIDNLANTADEPTRSNSILSAVDSFLQDHPTLRQVGQRLLTGFSDEDKAHLASQGITNIVGAPADVSVLPELTHPQDESWPGYLARGAYNQIIRPLGTASGFLGAANPAHQVGPLQNPVISTGGRDIEGLVNTAKDELANIGKVTKPAEVVSPNITPELTQPELPLQQAPELPTVNNPVPLSPQEQLMQKVQQSKPLNKLQQIMYTAERQQRLGKMAEIQGSGQAGFYARKGQLAGEYKKVGMEPLKLEQSDVDGLFDIIKNHPQTIGFNQIKAGDALAKVLNGQVPQRNEIQLLGRVFGPQFSATLSKNLPLIDKTQGWLKEGLNLPRALMASFDLSAPLRQGIGLIHTAEYWKSFNDMFKSFGSNEAFRGVMDSIEANPKFALAQDSGLAMTDLLGTSNREEQIMSNLSEKIPVIGAGVRASNRAYTGFLNKLRMDSFSKLIDSAQDAGLDPVSNHYLRKQIAGYVNTATGRGSLGSMEKYAEGLNSVFFSPRLIASRAKMLNPNTYIQMGGTGIASPEAAFLRKQYIKSALAMATAGTTVVELGRLAGGEVSNDPTSSDFRKLKIGNARLDPYGGHQQFITATSRLLDAAYGSATGNESDYGPYKKPTGLDTVGRFTRSKLNPVLGFAWSMLDNQREASGKPMNFTSLDPVENSVMNRFVPMLLQDVHDLALDDPRLMPLAIPSAFGAGVQDYQTGR